jgi:hypothetical protein
MKLVYNVVTAIILIIIFSSCEKVLNQANSSKQYKKDIPYILSQLANDYRSQINAIVDHIDDTLVFRCQGLSVFIPNLDTFKLMYVDSIAKGIGKNVYRGFTGNSSTGYVKGPNDIPISTADLGNLYFYIYTDSYQLEPDSSYSIVNIRFLYNTTEPPF